MREQKTPNEHLAVLMEIQRSIFQRFGERPSLAQLAEHFSCEVGDDDDTPYGLARSSMDSLLFHDDADRLALALDAGFPLEAPIGFHQGTPLAQCGLIGAPRCARLLLSRGACPNQAHFEWQSPIENAADCHSSERSFEVFLILTQAGALASVNDRQARFTQLASTANNHDPSTLLMSRWIRPLGLEFLRSLGRDWSDEPQRFEAGQGLAAFAMATVARLEAMAQASHMSLDGLLGMSFSAAIENAGLPGIFTQAYHARKSSIAMEQSTPKPSSPSKPTRHL